MDEASSDIALYFIIAVSQFTSKGELAARSDSTQTYHETHSLLGHIAYNALVYKFIIAMRCARQSVLKRN